MEKKNDWLWWLAIIVLLSTAAPIGLALLVYYLSKHLGKKSTKQVQIPERTGTQKEPASEIHQTLSEAMRTAGTAVDEAVQIAANAINASVGNQKAVQSTIASQHGAYVFNKDGGKAPAKAAPAKKPHKPKKPLSAGWAKFRLVLGGILAGTFTLSAIITGLDELRKIFGGSGSIWWLLEEVIPISLFACLGGALALWGYLGIEKARRFRRYQSLIQPERESLSVYALADALELKYSRVCSDLEEMIDRGYFEFAYLDRAHGRLVLSPNGAGLYDTQAAPQAAPQPAPAVSSEEEDNETLRRIRAANDAINNPELSAKIDEIEELTRKIFKLLEERPEKAESLHSFTAYYLPQTMKIMEAYARLESQGVEGENITAAKAKITAALDMLGDGYRQQLDQLFQDDVVDITADIAVMEQMLARDGLSGDELQPERRR